MFDVVLRVHKLRASFQKLDGNGETCGTWGNNCSPGAIKLHAPKTSKPGLRAQTTFVGSVFGAPTLHIHPTSGGGGGGSFSTSNSSGHGMLFVSSSSSSSSSSAAGSSSSQNVRGIWENAATGQTYTFSGHLSHSGSISFSHLTNYGKPHLRGAQLTLSKESQAGQNSASKSTANFFHSPSHLRASAGSSQSSHVFSLPKNGSITQTTGDLHAARQPAAGFISGQSDKMWSSFLNAGSTGVQGSLVVASSHLHATAAVQASTIATSSSSSSSIFSSSSSTAIHQGHSASMQLAQSYVTNKSIKGDWWDHSDGSSFLSQTPGLPNAMGALSLGSKSTGGMRVGKTTIPASVGVTTTTGRSDDLSCGGLICYYAPAPSTQSTIGPSAYHGV